MFLRTLWCLNSEISDVAIVNKIIDGIKVGRFREIAEAVQGDMDKVTMMSFTILSGKDMRIR